MIRIFASARAPNSPGSAEARIIGLINEHENLEKISNKSLLFSIVEAELASVKMNAKYRLRRAKVLSNFLRKLLLQERF